MDWTTGTSRLARSKCFRLFEGIAEFKVQVGNFDAEFASGGTVVNVIARSGSNEFHGSVFEFLRNSDADARQFFDAKKPQFQQTSSAARSAARFAGTRRFSFGIIRV